MEEGDGESVMICNVVMGGGLGDMFWPQQESPISPTIPQNLSLERSCELSPSSTTSHSTALVPAFQHPPVLSFLAPISPSGPQKISKSKRKNELDPSPGSCGKKPALSGSSLSSMDVLRSPGCTSASTAVQDWLLPFHNWCPSTKVTALTSLVNSCSINEIRHLKSIIEPFFQKDFISLLPKELALFVLCKLEPKDLVRAAQTCSYWRTLTEDHLLWREKCQEAGIDLPPTPSPSGSLHARSPWKALYLRYCRINTNWRNGPTPPPTHKILRGHDEHVITCLEISGDKIISGSDDDTLKVWSISSGQCIFTLVGHSGGVWCSQISEDGRWVTSGSTDRTVKVWDTDTGRCLHTLHGHTSTVRCMSLRGTNLVSGSRDTSLRVWDIVNGELCHVLTGHVAAVRCVKYDGKRAVSGAYDYTIKVWDVESEQCIYTLAGHTNRVYSLKFDSERDLVISGSLDTSIRVWDLRTGKCSHTLMGHQSLTSGMHIRGRRLVSGNADSTVKVWDISDGQCLHTLAGVNKHQSAVTSLQLLANGLVVTSSDDGTVKLWDTDQGTFVRDLVRLDSGGSGGCIWRLKATPTTLVCAAGSRMGTEDTKLIVLDFNDGFP